MALETFQKAKKLIDAHRHGDHIDDMTNLTPDPSRIPRIPVFYTLTKIHKPKPVGRLSYQAAKTLMNGSEVSEFPIFTNRSRVWPVYT